MSTDLHKLVEEFVLGVTPQCVQHPLCFCLVGQVRAVHGRHALSLKRWLTMCTRGAKSTHVNKRAATLSHKVHTTAMRTCAQLLQTHGEAHMHTRRSIQTHKRIQTNKRTNAHTHTHFKKISARLLLLCISSSATSSV